jgi:hypothetical protein
MEYFGNKVLIQRCQWHKWENMASYSPKSMQSGIQRKASGGLPGTQQGKRI